MPTPVACSLRRAEESKDTQRSQKLRNLPGRNPPELTTTYSTKNLTISAYRSTGNLEPTRRRLILDGMASPHEIRPLDVVALTVDVPDEGLVRGQVGTVVENLAPGVFEVEFSDDEGRTYAQLALKDDQLLLLHYQPQQAA